MRVRLRILGTLAALLAGCTTVRPAPSSAPSAAAGSTTPSREAGPEAIFEEFAPADAQRIAQVQSIVESAAAEHDLEPELVYAVIWVESRFQVRAESPAGARGLMQLMPATAAALAKELGTPRARSFDPRFNVTAGSYYLRRLLDRFDGDEVLALAAYKAGAGNVNKWRERGQGLPDYSQRYVQAVLEARARFRGTPLNPEREHLLADAGAATRTTRPPQPDPGPVPAETAPLEPPSLDRAPVEDEPVFEPRPDLDVRGEPRTRPRPPTPPAPNRGPAEVGIGVLPGVDE
jgi:hypothetical protein